MLELYINNRLANLSAGQSVDITATNPDLDPDGIPRAFTLPFRIPASAQNSGVRQHATRLDAAIPPDPTAEVHFQSDTLMQGYWESTGANEQEEEGSVTSTELAIWKKLEEVRISTLLDTIQMPLPQYLRWRLHLTPSSSTYLVQFGTVTITVNYPPVGGDLQAATNLANAINVQFPGMASSGFPNILWLDAVKVQQNPITGFSNMTMVESRTPGQYYQAAMHQHVNIVNLTPVDSHCFPVIGWENLYGTKNPGYTNVVNFWANGNQFENEKYLLTEDFRWKCTYIPFVKMPYIMEKIAAAVGFTGWAGEVWDDADWKKAIVTNNYTVDRVVTELHWINLGIGNVNYKMNCFKSAINLNQHVPDITAADFLRRIFRTFALRMEAKDGVLRLDRRKKKFAPLPWDITSIVSKQYSIKRPRSKAWALVYEKDEKETLPASATQLIPIRRGSNGPETALLPTWQYKRQYQLTDSGFAKVPFTSSEAESDATGGRPRSTYPFGLLFFHGLQPTILNLPYPMASHDNYTHENIKIGAYSLDITGPDGLYEQWHAGHIELSVGDVIDVEAHASYAQVRRLMGWERTEVTFAHPKGQVRGVVKSARVSFSGDDMSLLRLEVVKA